MPTYRVTLQTVASVTYTVTADDEDGAIDKAMDKAPYEAYGTGGAIYDNPVDLGEWGTESFRVDHERADDSVELVTDAAADDEDE